MLSADGKGANGPLVEFRLVAVEDSRVYLTQAGAAMASERIPARDDADGIDLMTDDMRRHLAKSLVCIPGEVQEIRLFLEGVDHARGAQDELDHWIAKSHDDWSDAQVVSHRAAMIGRLRDLTIVEVETVPKTTILRGAAYAAFAELLDTQPTTIPTEGA